MTVNLADAYREQFNRGLAQRYQYWRVLCRSYLQRFIPSRATVLELGCGCGEFIDAIEAERKIVVDPNPDAPMYLNFGIEFHQAAVADLSSIPDRSIDVVFASSTLHMLRDKTELNALFAEVRRVLRQGGRLVVLGPNIRYAYAAYWDYYGHQIPLSGYGLAEGLTLSDFAIEALIDRFIPHTTSGLPTSSSLLRLYLALPPVWRIFGRQYLVVARKKPWPI